MRYVFVFFWYFLVLTSSAGQIEVPITSYQVNNNGQVEIEVNSTTDHYYVLMIRHDPRSDTQFTSSITLGEPGTTTLTESLKAYPEDHYRVFEYEKTSPGDIDNDGKNDLVELTDLGRNGPLNPAPPISTSNGLSCLHSLEDFQRLSYTGLDVLIDTHLENLEFVKFYILEADTDHPQVYFMNTVRFRAHFQFAQAIGIPPVFGGPGSDIEGQMRGEIIYHPKVEGPNGQLGVFRFEFEPNDSYSFNEVQMANELLSKNMPFLENNWAYFPMPNAALPKYFREQMLYDNSRVAVLFEEDIFDQISYIPFNLVEGYGLLRVMSLEERPGIRDVVIYEALPNELSRVGGIITTVPQTPLSHINLRAIQDKVPNAFIRSAVTLGDIEPLIGKHVYFKVEQDDYIIREASLAEVDHHFAQLRPDNPQIPERDLTSTSIKPLDDIQFEESSSFGVKCANLAAMRDFGFPADLIPDGYGIPFYFYDEFMKHNGLYDDAREMLSSNNFSSDFALQDEMLKAFRKKIRDAEMPQWMMGELSTLQAFFSPGTSIRCRSSTNNEDLPGFSGAGLYSSKTQHPEEGHISKSVKQVYASLWNFRAFVEREFYKVDHFSAAMGVLCHPNFSNELANGVGVSIDPLYKTEETFYINSQIGEDLVTNPDALSIPEEVLLDINNDGIDGFSLIRLSNQVENGTLVLGVKHMDDLRTYLQVIHDEFKALYASTDEEDFAMEIEYKITSDNRLSIKQARPWIFTDAQETTTATVEVDSESQTIFDVRLSPNPSQSELQASFGLKQDADIIASVFNQTGKLVKRGERIRWKSGAHSMNLIEFIPEAQAKSGYFFLRLDTITENLPHCSFAAE